MTIKMNNGMYFVYQQGFNELEKLLKQHGICIATTEKLLKDSGVPSEDFYDRIVSRLKQRSKAKGISHSKLPWRHS